MPASPPPPAPPPATLPAFVGRQPIFDGRMGLVGYELLFREDESNVAPPCVDGDSWTAQVVLNTFLDIGLDKVVGGHVAFINATRAFLLERLALHLPPHRVVIEVLEHVAPDAEVLEAIHELRGRGYVVALDDFVLGSPAMAMVPLAGIIKVDISQVDQATLRDYPRQLAGRGVRLLAERVETPDQFTACAAMGFEWFQGFFLARPSLVRGVRRRRTPHELSALRLLALLERTDSNLDEVLEALSRDPALSYRLLLVINSAAFGLRRRVESLRQALVMLGLRRVHGWVTLMLLGGLSDRPPELLATALLRARMCELLGERLDPGRGPSYFTTGLLSLLDVMLDAPWAEITPHLPLSAEVLAATTAREGRIGDLLTAVVHYERCEWPRVHAPGLRAADFRQAYLAAIEWTQHLLASPEAAGKPARQRASS
jgi:EAL and modified HD-GYP domain-containing signal transduction protein